MKKLLIYCFLLTCLSSPCFSRDFVVELVEEYYKEVQHQSKLSYSPFIYHSIQINFENRPKLLILTGKNHAYRQWLRQYIAQNRYFIVKLLNDEDNAFKSSQAYKIDVANIHPLKLSSPNDKELFQTKQSDSLQQKSDHRAKGRDNKEAADRKAAQGLADRQEAEQKRLEQEKARKAETERKSAENQKQKEESEKERIAREKKLNAKAAKDALEEQMRREKTDKELLEREKELRAQAEREAALEQLRREEADKRWLEREKELRERAIQEALEERKRRKEADKRWARRKRFLKANRY